MLDLFVERWLGRVLVVAGCLCLATSALLVVGWIEPQLPPTPPGITTLVYLRPMRYQPDLYLTGGLALVLIGIHLMRHFRRESQQSRPSA